jgi:cytochrome c
LFKNNCASCHKRDKDFTGPALKGSLERWGDKKAMFDFIRNPGKSIVENAYAKQLFEKWNRTMMTPSSLSDTELDAIMNYCETPIQ